MHMNDPLQVPNSLCHLILHFLSFTKATYQFVYHANDPRHILSGKYGPHWVSTESFPLSQVEHS